MIFLHQSSIHQFCHIILLWSARHYQLPQNPFRPVEIIEFIQTKFQSIICAEMFYLLHSLLLCLLFLEGIKHVTFLLQEENPKSLEEIINYCQQIVCTSFRRHHHQSPNIEMYIIKCFLRALSPFGESSST